jgi:hypothetical protein
MPVDKFLHDKEREKEGMNGQAGIVIGEQE